MRIPSLSKPVLRPDLHQGVHICTVLVYRDCTYTYSSSGGPSTVPAPHLFSFIFDPSNFKGFGISIDLSSVPFTCSRLVHFWLDLAVYGQNKQHLMKRRNNSRKKTIQKKIKLYQTENKFRKNIG